MGTPRRRWCRSDAIPEPHYPFHDRTIVVTSCGRLCLYRKTCCWRMIKPSWRARKIRERLLRRLPHRVKFRPRAPFTPCSIVTDGDPRSTVTNLHGGQLVNAWPNTGRSTGTPPGHAIRIPGAPVYSYHCQERTRYAGRRGCESRLTKT